TVNNLRLSPVGQSLAKSYSVAERREIALNYVACAYGTKAGYAASVGGHPTTILDWAAALADGDLERGLVPR
uniref:hypothetical protein n=2 Tax=Trueperella pyogenes TaxID=1661 RepID=UPI0019D71141